MYFQVSLLKIFFKIFVSFRFQTNSSFTPKTFLFLSHQHYKVLVSCISFQQVVTFTSHQQKYLNLKIMRHVLFKFLPFLEWCHPTVRWNCVSVFLITVKFHCSFLIFYFIPDPLFPFNAVLESNGLHCALIFYPSKCIGTDVYILLQN